jgi:tetratricopeptide (TPR) repeat protein
MPTAEIPSESSGSGRRYAAFISYSHRDRKWAEWLHRAIENYRIPKNLAHADEAGNSQAAALGPIFIDRAELPSSSDLAASVRAALESSAYLIIICSPDAARSRWVNEEIRTFKALGRAARILCLIVAGNPAGSADDSSGSGQCFPAALRFQLDGEAISNVLAPEPLAADIRPGHDDRNSARLKIIAGLLSVPFDRLRQREHIRRQRRLVMITTASAIGCIAFGVLAAAALLARNEANRQRIVADQQRILADQQSRTARRTADFLKSLFVVSNPSEARGNSITAREVLDRGVKQVAEQLKDEPMVRADLTTTLGDVYTNLGLLKEAEHLLKSAREVPSQPIDANARESLALGEVQYQRGENDAALVSLQEALRLADSAPANDPLLRSKILFALAKPCLEPAGIGKTGGGSPRHAEYCPGRFLRQALGRGRSRIREGAGRAAGRLRGAGSCDYRNYGRPWQRRIHARSPGCRGKVLSQNIDRREEDTRQERSRDRHHSQQSRSGAS